MGVDGIKPKVASNIGGAAATAEAKPIEKAKEINPPEPIKTKAPADGVDVLKKKIMSVSGRFKADKTKLPERADLKDLIANQRMSINAGGSAAKVETVEGAEVAEIDDGKMDGTLDTASSKGKEPAAREAKSDFVAQAKAAAPKNATPAQIDAAANKLARAALEKDFGVKVKDGESSEIDTNTLQPKKKEWTTEELSRAHEAFASMPAGDQAKLKGLDLVRDSKASPESQKEMGDKGTVAGEYKPNTKTTDGKRDKPGQIALYDAAFTSRKDSIHVITHEAGHAVEGRTRDDAMSAWMAANDKVVEKAVPLNAAAKADSDAGNEFGAAAKKLGGAAGNDKPKGAFVKAANDSLKAEQAMRDAKTPADVTAAQTKIDAAKKARDAALQGLSGKTRTNADAVAAAMDKMDGTSKAYADANQEYLPVKAVADGKMDDLKKVATVTQTVNGEGKKITHADTSAEQASFAKARGNEKPVSGYGKSKGTEGYAEAYALYQRDPKFMHDNFPKQYKFFHDNHLSANDK